MPLLLPKDKLLHLAIGALVALCVLLLWVALAIPGLVTLDNGVAACLIGSAVAGATKEAADWMDNRIHPRMHGVEWGDAIATAAGGVPVALALWGYAQL